jgi:hypothetical protein
MFKNKWRLRKEAREEEERRQLNFLYIFNTDTGRNMKVTLPRLKFLENRDEDAA